MNSSSIIKYIVLFIVIVFLIAGIQIARVYNQVYGSNIQTPEKESFNLFIPTGSEYNDVLNLLYENEIIINKKSFEWTAEKKNYPRKIFPGRYVLTHDMSNNELINTLRSGIQQPVQLVINNARTHEDLAERVSEQIEADEESLLTLLNNDDFLSEYGFNHQTVISMFIPNTYEFWWNTGAESFIDRMFKEYKSFWTASRLRKAEEAGLSAVEVATLASIVVAETNKEDEYDIIAGVYINRLKKGIPLQADPTIKFAIGDFERQRILTIDTRVDSPYNTYLYTGLPPGPISMVPIKAIDAVLNYEGHEYIFFCAKDDFSGYHVFAETLAQHNRNARLYQNALNQRNIMR